MKIITRNPVYTHEVYFNADGDKKEKLKKAGAIAGTIGTAALGILAAKASQGPSDIKQACGKKPLFKKNRAAYDACVRKQSGLGNSAPQTRSYQPENTPPPKQGMSKTLKIGLGIGAGVVVLFLGYLAFRNKQQAAA